MKADLHVHSVYSANDGKQTVDDILRECRLKGIGAVALTDHNAVGAWQDAEGIEDVIIIKGIEVTTAEGHVLGYGINKDIPRGLPVDETVRLIHEAGGIAVAAHPYRWWSGIGGENVEGMGFDAVEGINGRSLKGGNYRAQKLAEKLGLPVTGGSDAHTSPSVGRTYTIVPDDCRTSEDLISAIVSNKCGIGGDNRSRLSSLKYVGMNILRWIKRGCKRI